jgi:hypothetical protein
MHVVSDVGHPGLRATMHAKALIGWYSFKGTDKTGRFITKALKSHLKTFLATDDDTTLALSVFGNEDQLSQDIFRQMELYVCLLYKPAGSRYDSFPDIRWSSFTKCSKKGGSYHQQMVY